LARGTTITLGSLDRREFRRLLVVSAAAHVLFAFFLGYSPGGEVTMPQGVIAVQLVAPPPSATPAPRAAARPAPPPPPRPKEVVLPREASLPEPRPAAKQEPPKPKPEAEPAQEEPAEKDYADVLSELRSEAGDEEPSPEAAPQQTAAIGSPEGQPVSPEFMAWERKARIHIRQNWVVPPSFRNEPLRTSIVVELDAAGAVVGEPRIVKRSGNPWYDEGVVRSIQKASPLPPPPEAGDWSFVFVADESF
jgi:hypothetical protein